MQETTSTARRRLLSLLAAGAALTPLARIGALVAADLPHLAADDAQAKSLGYVLDATKLTAQSESAFKPGSHCGGCVLYQGGSAEWGGCAVFPGKSVHNAGWCRSYTPKG